MLKYIRKRLLYGILVMLGVITLVFFLFNILPGDPARMMLGQRADQESVDLINKDLGRDKPMPLQYLNYLNDLIPISFHNNCDTDSYFYLNPDKYAVIQGLDNYIVAAGVDTLLICRRDQEDQLMKFNSDVEMLKARKKQ